MRKMKKILVFVMTMCMIASMRMVAGATNTAAEVNVQFDAQGGYFDWTHCDGRLRLHQSDTGQGVEVGQPVVSVYADITDPVADNATFLGWEMECDGTIVSPSQAAYWTTQDALDYVATSAYETIVFKAVYNNQPTTVIRNGSFALVETNGGEIVYSYNGVTNTVGNGIEVGFDSGETLRDYISIDSVSSVHGTFLGWNACVNDVWDDTLLTTDEVLDYAFTGQAGNEQFITFAPQWKSVNVQINACGGTMSFVYGDHAETDVENFGVGAAPGIKIGDIFVGIADPVYWTTRGFAGWTVKSVDENDNWTDLADGLTTAELCEFVIPEEYENIYVDANWEGDNFDYTSIIGFEDWFDGEFTFTLNNETPETTNGIAWECKEDGTAFLDQYDFAIVAEPTHPDYTFEGWLVLSEETGFVSDTVYTTAEVLAMPVQEYNVHYVVKWAELPMEAYTESSSGSDKIMIFDGNDGVLNITLTYADGVEEGTMDWAEQEVIPDYSFSMIAVEQEVVVEMVPVKDGMVFTGWTLYEAADAAVEPTTTGELDGELAEGQMAMYAESEEVFIIFIDCVEIASGLTTQELFDFVWDDSYYYAVANYEVPGGDSGQAGESGEGEAEVEEEYVVVIESEIVIPEAVANQYATVAAVEYSLKEAIEETETLNKDTMEIVYMEITLKMLNADGEWEVVTEENFPEEGIDVVIPYPEGTNATDYDFVISHLISSGEKAGQVEILNGTKEADGIHVHVYSLSPFGVAYEKAELNAPADPSVPQTGDMNSIGLWLTTMTASLGTVVACAKKRREE